jgi:hypothetical protein
MYAAVPTTSLHADSSITEHTSPVASMNRFIMDDKPA